MQIILVRPGATEFDRQNRLQGRLDVPMSEDGRERIQGVCQELQGVHPSAIYASPTLSAAETAEAIGQALDAKTKTLKKLPNLDYGLWQGMLVAEVKEKQPRVYRQWQEQPETVCPPQGESVGAVRQRATESLRKLLKKHRANGPIVLVAPEPLASVIRLILEGAPLGDLWKVAERAGAWERIEAPETLDAPP